MRSLGLAAILLLTLSTVGMAQPNHPPRGEFKNFLGVAKHLDTTGDALEQWYVTAHQANPRLSRGQFVKALVLEQSLKPKKQTVTAKALLDGLAAGKTVDQTLETLGLTTDEAKAADSSAQSQVTLYAQEA
jgi:hypothetical protein